MGTMGNVGMAMRVKRNGEKGQSGKMVDPLNLRG